MISRSLFFIFILAPFILIGLPIQALIVKLNLPFWHVLPRGFHRLSCIFLGLRVHTIGQPERRRPTLLVSNHISWTDIIAVGSVADVTFVAKSEIARWFFVGFMASLQRTIFVDRNKRSDARRTSSEMAERMAGGRTVLLFAEGQSGLGTHVLPFRSALIGAAQAAMESSGAHDVVIQPLTIAYTRLQGLPVSQAERSLIAWVKSKTLKDNIREILGGGVKDVTLVFGKPVPLSEGGDRKSLSKRCEADVRAALVALNRGAALPETAA